MHLGFERLLVDLHPSHKSKEVKTFRQQIGTTLRILEESTQWASLVDLYIGIIKEAIRKDIRETHSPLVLWDYCAKKRTLILNMTARHLFQVKGYTPHTATFGTKGDISNICQYRT